MYTIGIKRNFVAQHFLIVGDGGAENQRHSHHYLLEVALEGPGLDDQGYLVDIDELSAIVNELLNRYRDRTLNELSEFKGINPSLEHFARILGQAVAERLVPQSLKAVAIKLWENDEAWAAYRHSF